MKLTFFLYEEFLSTIMYILKCLVLFSFYVSNLHHRLSYSLKIDLNIGINVPITSIAHRYWSKSWKLTIINSNNSLIYFCIIMISFITMKVYYQIEDSQQYSQFKIIKDFLSIFFAVLKTKYKYYQ